MKSQTATIEIFGILLANMGKQIPSQNFPISSYSRNKNEMLSKIIVPFERLVQAKTGKRIDVDCSGGVGEFFLRLAHDGNMDIAIIEKI
ncbi:MAG: hypothetical protein QG650_869 [Patescibacteria group bacterium]|nr:hypothetical protein [Patescibacteria group bacterium]